ncbi:MAG: phospholipid methyltransferase [Betaproteobacteria bacterium RIFCSPLOWO2_02_FULL_65_24]|nr:MAG: phospholipid methyltransferase [Betaproteobacteria bacterium RIFCSPLOWO2_02_FULL_65_24]OGA93228.1 MAG: phospholipid methyltransferase [Betaproteobacteria bacterium RIFCSPLOWO2_12_FULL_66_14]
MGIYERWLLPRLLDLVMRNEEATRYRMKTIPAARGRVLEIGAGSGLNLPFYGAGVTRLYALDPSRPLLDMAGRKHPPAGLPVEFLERSAEEIPLESHSIDTVVTTWTLCTVPDPAKALHEARRVLKPGGALLFAEHGHAPDPGVLRWQRRLNPLWLRIAGGCNLDRRIDRLIREAGFEILELQNEYAKGPRPFTYTYWGRARPA